MDTAKNVNEIRCLLSQRLIPYSTALRIDELLSRIIKSIPDTVDNKDRETIPCTKKAKGVYTTRFKFKECLHLTKDKNTIVCAQCSNIIPYGDKYHSDGRLSLCQRCISNRRYPLPSNY